MSLAVAIDPSRQLSNAVNAVFIFGLLFSGFAIPIDKLFLVAFLGYIIFINRFQIQVKLIQISLLLYWFFLAFISSLYNMTFNPMIFFPVIGIFFVITIINTEWLRIFHKVLFFYILICFAFGVWAYLGGARYVVTSLADKGLPFIFPLKGFTSTVQTFGSLCLLWLVINFEIGGKRYGWKFFLVFLTIFFTFNRSTYLFLLIILAVYSRTFLWISGVLLLIGFIAFYEMITAFFFNFSTLQSRQELLQGFYIAYWNDNTFLGYLLGKANNFYAPEILRQVKWDHRPDIENGYAMLLHTYGFLGLLGYLISTLALLVYAVVIKQSYRLACILIIYLFMTQFFTQEFVTNIFYLFIATILTLLHPRYENSSN